MHRLFLRMGLCLAAISVIIRKRGRFQLGLYLKQRVFSWGDSFYAYDALENERYRIQGEVFSWGKKLHLYDLQGAELAYIEQKLLTFLPRFAVFQRGVPVAEVVKEFTLFRHAYRVDGLGWTVEGDFWGHDYRILDGERTVATVNKAWLTFGDTYHIDITDGYDEALTLAVVLVIDACIEMAED